MIRLVLLVVLVVAPLVATAHAARFDGLSGDELPSPPYLAVPYCFCPPEPFSEYTQCWFLWQTPGTGGALGVTLCRYRDADPWPELPGGFGAWNRQAATPCAADQGANGYLLLLDRRRAVADHGCWSP